MPIDTLKGLAHRERSRSRNRSLGAVLAFVAGGINAGGFLAVHRYTSHMTGVVSAIADDLVLGNLALVLGGLALLLAFLFGAVSTALLSNWARRRGLHSEFALPLTVEACLLLAFGLMGSRLQLTSEGWIAPATVLLLCFVMGLQNAMITKASKAEIRTTHMTGIITDIGIEIGRLLYRNHEPRLNERHFVRADRDRLAIHAMILGLFIGGGIAGALAFRSLGFAATLPFAALLCVIAAPPLLRDAAQLVGQR